MYFKGFVLPRAPASSCNQTASTACPWKKRWVRQLNHCAIGSKHLPHLVCHALNVSYGRRFGVFRYDRTFIRYILCVTNIFHAVLDYETL